MLYVVQFEEQVDLTKFHKDNVVMRIFFSFFLVTKFVYFFQYCWQEKNSFWLGIGRFLEIENYDILKHMVKKCSVTKRMQ